MPMFLVTFMALLFWIATWLTIQIVCEPFRRGTQETSRSMFHVLLGSQSKSERLFSAEAPRIRTGPQLQAAGRVPEINAAMRTPQKPGPRLKRSHSATVEGAALFK